tara:strand:+ start:478 stop:1116 length:639 start_codon:yes stop_codon:yes gene_type:complete
VTYPDLIGSEKSRWTLVLSHGAGASTASDFFDKFSMRLVEKGKKVGGIRLAIFDFPYMRKTISTGRRYFPDPMPKLQEAYLKVIDELNVEVGRLLIGGKSMGGRVASMVVERSNASALVCLGYPFHPKKQPDKHRTAHLKTISVPTLICQGTRDPLGSLEEVTQYHLSSFIELVWLPDGDHDFMPRKRSGHTFGENLDKAVAEIIRFVNSLA